MFATIVIIMIHHYRHSFSHQHHHHHHTQSVDEELAKKKQEFEELEEKDAEVLEQMGLWDRIMYESQREKKLKELTAQIAKENKAKSSDKGAENKAVSMRCIFFLL
jgi:ABC-type protease/lipase transport system fused ATPase/permease subunit